MTLEESLRKVCADRGVEFLFMKKYSAKDKLTMCFSRDGGCWVVEATIGPWSTPEEHDGLFSRALAGSLDRKLEELRRS